MSVSQSIFGLISKEEEVFGFLKELSVEVAERLQKINRKGQQLTLKLKVRRPDQPMETLKHMGMFNNFKQNHNSQTVV